MKGHYLVTGGAGFIGAHLVERLLDAGSMVSVVDDFSTGTPQRLSGLANCDRFKIVEGDIRDRSHLKVALDGLDGIFHLAARVSVPDCIDDWLGNHSINGTGMLAMFDLVRDTGRIPVVYASSAAVYGDRSELRCNEEMLGRPISPYGADKLACENHANAFWAIHGIPSAGLRFFNVYGPGQHSGSPYAGVISRFVQSIRSGHPPEIHGDGLQSRDFVYVSNVVDALTAAMARITRKPEALVCNVCTGTSHTVRDIARIVAQVLEAGPLRPVYGPARGGDIRYSCGDPDKMSKSLGLGPFTPLDKGLSRWLRASDQICKAS